MAREQFTEKIGKHEYMFVQFGPKQSLRILTKLGKYLGGPLAELMSKKDPQKNLLDTDIGDEVIGSAIERLMGSVDNDDVYNLVVEICSCVILKSHEEGRISGRLTAEVIEEHFAGTGGLKQMFLVVKKAMEVNYSDFLGDVAAKVQLAQGDK